MGNDDKEVCEDELESLKRRLDRKFDESYCAVHRSTRLTSLNFHIPNRVSYIIAPGYCIWSIDSFP